MKCIFMHQFMLVASVGQTNTYDGCVRFKIIEFWMKLAIES